MNKTWFLPALAFALFACNDGADPAEKDNYESVTRNYLSVNILTPKASTRDDVVVNEDDYQDGNDSENNINSVRFFFFDNEGNAALVRKQAGATDGEDAYTSYIDWIPTASETTSGNPNQTVEKILTATLGINQPANSNPPQLVLAVLNPPQTVLNLQGNPNLSTLLNEVKDYKTGLTDNNFVITNSVYVNSDSKVVNATPINENNFQPTEDEAADPKNQLNIFVERVLARLDLSIGMTPAPGTTGNIYKLDKEYSVDGSETPEPIYVKLLGWNVTETTTTSRLVKTINPGWPSTLFSTAGQPWNISDLNRSFWAVNPETVAYQRGTFNDPEEGGNDNPNTANALQIPATDSYTTVYLQENANPYSEDLTAAAPTTPSKIILAAQLVKQDGTAQPLVRWANRYYTKQGALNAVTNSLNLYQIVNTAEGTGYKKITPDDLKFVSANDLYGEKLPEDVANYYVYLQLTEDAEKITWYYGNNESAQVYDTPKANNYILNIVNNLMYWNQGYTYYYLDIKHLGDEGTPGYVGVVRNHLYKANVNSIAGLGTPVFYPDDVIYPEMPGYDDSVLSAVINILQWRVVTKDYDFLWP